MRHDTATRSTHFQLIGFTKKDFHINTSHVRDKKDIIKIKKFCSSTLFLSCLKTAFTNVFMQTNTQKYSIAWKFPFTSFYFEIVGTSLSDFSRHILFSGLTGPKFLGRKDN